MKMTVAQAKTNGYVDARYAVGVLIDPKTGNILYFCDDADHVTDAYTTIGDPATNGAVFNMLCNDHRRSRSRKRFTVKIAALIQAGAEIWLEGKYQKLTASLAKRLNKANGWFPELDL
jgi:hypothetical protein